MKLTEVYENLLFWNTMIDFICIMDSLGLLGLNECDNIFDSLLIRLDTTR